MRPILLELPLLHRPLYSYGVLLGLSFGVGWYLVLALAERSGIARATGRRLFAVTALSALLGARLLFVVTNPGLWTGWAGALDVSGGGLVAYGGFLGGFLGGAVACRLSAVPLLVFSDAVVPALGTGLALTRTGCFLNGCDFGRPSRVPWAIAFPHGSPAFHEQLRQGLVSFGDAVSLPVHPTQLYEVAIGLALLALTLRVRASRLPAGSALCAFTAGYAVLRAAVEVYRADPQRGAIGPFSTSQLIAAVTLLAAAALGAALLRRSLRAPPP